MKKDNKSSAGFTILELMMSVALLGLIVGLSMSSYLALAKAANIATKCSEMHTDLREAMDIMSRDIMCSGNVMAAGSNYIKLEARRTATTQTVYYIHSAGKLYQLDSSLKIIADDVDEFQYTLYAEDGVTVAGVATNAWSIDMLVKTERTLGTEVFDDVLQTRVMLRNKGL